jgi:hypothetical protein
VRLNVILLVIGTVFLLSSSFSYALNDTININITIGPVSQINVVPNALNWTQQTTGLTGGVINFTIKNAGSENVTNIIAYVNTNETETLRPYGSSNPSDFSSGGLIVIKNNSASKMYWVQRKEWNWTRDIANIDLGAISPYSRAARGFFRNTSLEYVWAVGNGTEGLCNNTGTLFAIEDDNDLGASDTRTPTTTGIVRDGGDGDYSYFSVNRATAPLSDMCVAVSKNCDYILAYKYDRRGTPSGFGTCSNAADLRSEALPPGETDDIHIDAWIPNGVPSGQLAIAILTIQSM